MRSSMLAAIERKRTPAIDFLNGEVVMRLLRRHCDEGGAALLVTHDAAHAAWADRVVFLRDGRIVGESRPAPTEAMAVTDPPLAVAGGA